MPIDPDELKARRIKREQQVREIQEYMEQQDALDATGKMGNHEVKHRTSIGEKTSNFVNKAFNFLKK